MERMTITEALSEIKLIEKRVDKKKASVLANVSRFEHVMDPYARDGGSGEYVKRELQAIGDLWGRLVKFREAIARANVENTITVEGVTKSISQWLAWKRDVQEKQLELWQTLGSTASMALRQSETTPKLYKGEDDKPMLARVILNVEAPEINKQLEHVMTIKEKLDGQLSLKNATVVVAID